MFRRSLLLVAFVAIVASACTTESNPVTVTTTGAPSTIAVTSTSTPSTSATTRPAPTEVAEAVPPIPTTAAPTTTASVEPPASTARDASLELALVPVATGFEQPVFVTQPSGDSRLFVVDQPGVIWVIDDGDPLPFLDIRDRVSFGGERGLLGMAFHPDFGENGLFFVNYIDLDGDTRVSEFTVGDDPDQGERGSERIVLSVPQPAGNHNGGMIAFGPDGFLWIGMGDGGGSGDRFGHGQRADTLLGSMLRIHVGPEAPEPYAIPVDNPFVDGDGAPEVWATGLRNPWRFSFDGMDLWIADVGQGTIEEINRTSAAEPGINYGWPVFEGTECFGTAGACTDEGFVFPVHEYGHGDACSVTGGYVYRGSAVPELDGHYLFSDFCDGFIRSIGPDGAVHDWTAGTGTVNRVTSFGIDGDGEVFVVSGDGTIFEITRVAA